MKSSRLTVMLVVLAMVLGLASLASGPYRDPFLFPIQTAGAWL